MSRSTASFSAASPMPRLLRSRSSDSLLVIGRRVVRAGQLRVDRAEGDVVEFIKAEFGASATPAASRPRADQPNVRAERRGDGPRQHEHDVRADAAHRFGQAIAGGAEAATDERRKFPPEHENTHGRIAFSPVWHWLPGKLRVARVIA